MEITPTTTPLSRLNDLHDEIARHDLRIKKLEAEWLRLFDLQRRFEEYGRSHSAAALNVPVTTDEPTLRP